MSYICHALIVHLFNIHHQFVEYQQARRPERPTEIAGVVKLNALQNIGHQLRIVLDIALSSRD